MTALPPGTLYRITAPHFCAGLVADNRFVVGAAPILRWAVGKSLAGVLAYCGRKGWTVEELSCSPQWRFNQSLLSFP